MACTSFMHQFCVYLSFDKFFEKRSNLGLGFHFHLAIVFISVEVEAWMGLLKEAMMMDWSAGEFFFHLFLYETVGQYELSNSFFFVYILDQPECHHQPTIKPAHPLVRVWVSQGSISNDPHPHPPFPHPPIPQDWHTHDHHYTYSISAGAAWQCK